MNLDIQSKSQPAAPGRCPSWDQILYRRYLHRLLALLVSPNGGIRGAVAAAVYSPNIKSGLEGHGGMLRGKVNALSLRSTNAGQLAVATVRAEWEGTDRLVNQHADRSHDVLEKTVEGGCDRYENRFGGCLIAHVSRTRVFQ